MNNRLGSRSGRALLWILIIIVVLIVLSLLFGGFQKGTKAAPRAQPAYVSLTITPPEANPPPADTRIAQTAQPGTPDPGRPSRTAGCLRS